MLAILLGPDGFSKKQYIKDLAAKEKAEVAVLVQPEVLPIDQLTSQDLFAAKKIFVLQDALKLINEQNLQSLIDSNNKIIITEEKIDKRTTFGKNLANNKKISLKEFALPHGRELNRWIEQRVKTWGGKIHSAAVEQLAISLGRDEAKETKFGGKVVEVQEVYNLGDVDNEIQKLLAYADGQEINQQMVKDLVPMHEEADVLQIVNAIGENNRQLAFEQMQIFLAEETAADEKGKIIQLNALLSEQFRNVAAVQDFLQRQIPEPVILEQTEWKPGRLFVMKKLATKFPHKKVVEVLHKLSALDEELKISSTPPRVLLDLIFSQL